MELFIIFVVVSFLIGTISFALPSKSSKKISELRMNASRLGLKITPSKIRHYKDASGEKIPKKGYWYEYNES